MQARSRPAVMMVPVSAVTRSTMAVTMLAGCSREFGGDFALAQADPLVRVRPL